MARGAQPTPTEFPDREPQRLRFSQGLPVPRDRYEFDWSKERDEWRGWSVADVVLACTETTAWQKLLRPRCEKLDAGRRTFLYSAEKYEMVLLFGRLNGCKTVKETRTTLANDLHGKDRRLLGLTEDRTWRGGLERVRAVGVPSEASICRHRQRLPDHERLHVLREVWKALRDELLAVADAEEFDLLFLDGTELPTHWTPEYSARRRRPRNGVTPKTTCLDGGTRRGVDGYQAIIANTPHGACLGYAIEAVNHSEARLAVGVIEGIRKDVFSKLPERVRVATTDAAFNHAPLRLAMRRAGLVDNIMLHSGKDDPTTRNEVAKATRARIPVHGFPNWRANGFRELLCRCGHGTTSKRITRNGDGTLAARLEGACPSCGPIEVTAGDWRRSTGPNAAFRRLQRHDRPEEMDSLGVPLTYRDLVSRVYRNKRMGLNEGFFGALRNRTGFNRGKSWYRTKAQAEIALLETLIPLTALAVLRKKATAGRARLPARK